MSDDPNFSEDPEEYVEKQGGFGRKGFHTFPARGRHAGPDGQGGRHREVPVSVQNMAMAVGTLGYVISPIDAIPDFIPLLGLTDDIGMTALTVSLLSAEIAQFHDWENEQKEEAA